MQRTYFDTRDDKFTFHCGLRAYPRPTNLTHAWYHNNEVIMNRPNIEISEHRFELLFYTLRTSALTIRNVSSSDVGDYHCKYDDGRRTTEMVHIGKLELNLG